MAYDGWICIHRKIQDNPIWLSNKPFDDRAAWIDLLLMANHKDRDVQIGNQIITVKKGQRFTSIRKLALKWNWSRDRVSRYLDMLAQAGMIYKDSIHNGTLLTIVKYDFFQHLSDTNKDTDKDTSRTQARTRVGHQQGTNNNDNNDLTMTNNEKTREPAPPHGGGEWQ